MENSKPYTRISTAAIAAARVLLRRPQRSLRHPPWWEEPLLCAYRRRPRSGRRLQRQPVQGLQRSCRGNGRLRAALGRKAIERCHRLGLTMLTDDYPRVEGMSVGTCYHLARLLLDGYDAERYDELWLVYTNFVSMMTQEVMIEQLLPVQRPPEGAPHKLVSTVYELPPAETLAQVLPDFLAGRLFSALCDAFASEVAARRSAMDSATKNAGEMISDLKLRYNRARQGAITQEITEIVAGAEH